MKLYLSFWILFLGLNVFAQTTDLELIAVKNENTIWAIDYTFKIKNKGAKAVKFMKLNDMSYMNFGAPTFEFVAETFVDGKWKKFKDPKVPQIDYSGHTENSILSIKPNEEIEIGHLFRNRELSSWFNLLNDAKLNVYFIYKTDPSRIKEYYEKSELKDFNPAPMTLISNKIEINYKNTLSKKKYEEAKQYYINRAFGEYIKKTYTSSQLLKSMKKIKNLNGECDEILSEVLGEKPFKYIDYFTGKTKDGFNFRGILYKIDNKIHLGIYAGKHYFIKKKKEDENQPLEYLFGEVTYDPTLLTNYLYKN